MNDYNSNKKYQSFKIPARQQVQESESAHELPQVKAGTSVSLDDGSFYVIDYGLSDIKGAGKFVLKSQQIQPPAKDEIRDRFYSMRDIARVNSSLFLANNRFFDQRTQQDNANIFYKQGMFMKDFSDSYTENTPFSSYFPNYQMMGYEQLRTYFTWRTEVRKGNVNDTALSYAFLYIYELLNNIGAADPEDGLEKLMFFWKAFSVHNNAIDKYVLRWLKDYHIYYMMPQPFKEFVGKNNLAQHYPKMTDTEDNFDLFCAVSKYDIRQSAFYTNDNIKLITDCFTFVFNLLKQVFTQNGMNFDQSIFQPTKKMLVWRPFKDALFHQWMKQPDRQIVLSEKEIYICRQNNWFFNTVITSESGKKLIGYILKQMESVLRKAAKYKHKLSANINAVNHELIGKLDQTGLSLEKIINDAVFTFYREATKTVVSVDHSALSRIRQEALVTQEKLIIPETEEPSFLEPAAPDLSVSAIHATPPMLPSAEASVSDVWQEFKTALSATEMQALALVLQGNTHIKHFADKNDIMLEVLADGINEKAMDFIGDNLLDNDFRLYDDYIIQVKEMAG